MEEIIKKAIKGGYEKERYYFDSNGNFDDEPYEVVLMKSSFWQSLGKAEGWGDKKVLTSYGVTERNTWLHYAKMFHEINLTQGFDKAVEYLTSLLTKEN